MNTPTTQTFDLRTKLKHYAQLIRFNRPIGTLLLLWPTLTALWIAAEGFPGWTLFWVFLAGTFFMRSAGCAINDYADRDIDLLVARTQNRPITSGAISPKEALIVAAGLAFCSFLLLFFTNLNTMLMSVIALFLAAIYPFSKRFTHLPQLFLGAAFSWAIPMAFTAVGTPLSKTTWLLFIATVLWAMVYDTMYAMADREDDLKIGVKSTAILFGDADVLIVSVVQLMVILTLIIVGKQIGLSAYYFAGVAVASGFSIYHYTLIRKRDPIKCFSAFLNNNYFGLSVFAGVYLHYMFAAEQSI